MGIDMAPGGMREVAESPERESFLRAMRKLIEIVGEESEGLPPRPAEKDIERKQHELIADDRYATLSEQFRANELMQMRHGLQRELDVQQHPNDQKKKRELITVRQAETYFEYFPAILRDLTNTLATYERVRKGMDTVPFGQQQKELQAVLYMHALTTALERRVQFANVLLLQGKMRDDARQANRYQERLDAVLRSGALTEEDRAALRTGTHEGKWAVGNALNQRIIDLLAKPSIVPGVDERFLPQTMLIDLITAGYQKTLEEEQRLAADPRLTGHRRRVRALEEKSQTQSLSEEEREEHRRLQTELLQTRDVLLGDLKKRRTEWLDLLVNTTFDMAGDQFRRAELSAIQNQFGDHFDFERLQSPNPNHTPEEIQKSMTEHMERRKQFHLERMTAFTHALDEKVLTSGIAEVTEHFSNKRGRKAVEALSNLWATVFTAPVPEFFGLQDMAHGALTDPLQRALGWPAGKQTWEELTEAERQEIEKKSRSVLEIIRAFDRTKIERFEETVSLVRSMPHASEFAGQNVQEPLPVLASDERITSENLQGYMERYGGPTVYLLLFRQMNLEFGASNPTTGVLGEYGAFLTATNENVGTHIDVGGSLHTLSRRYVDLMWYIWAVAGLSAFAGAAIMALLLGAVRGASRAGAAMSRAGVRGARLASRIGVEGVKRGADALRSLRGVRLPVSVGRAARPVLTKVGAGLVHVAGGAAAIATAHEIYRLTSQQEVPPWSEVDLGLEFLESNPGAFEAMPYATVTRILRQRQDARHIKLATAHVLKLLEQEGNENREMIDFCNTLLRDAEAFDAALAQSLPLSGVFGVASGEQIDVQKKQITGEVSVRRDLLQRAWDTYLAGIEQGRRERLSASVLKDVGNVPKRSSLLENVVAPLEERRSGASTMHVDTLLLTPEERRELLAAFMQSAPEGDQAREKRVAHFDLERPAEAHTSLVQRFRMLEHAAEETE